MDKSTQGSINLIGGLIGERIIGNMLEQLNYKVYFPKNLNEKGYDLLAEKENRHYMIQVKTDMNNDGKCP